MARQASKPSRHAELEATETEARAEHELMMARITAKNAADRAADPALWAEIDRKNAERRAEPPLPSAAAQAHRAQRLTDVALEQDERAALWEQVQRDAAEDEAL